MAAEMTLKKNLMYLAKEKGWSLSHLAREARMNKSTLQGYMTGVTPRGLENLILLAKFLGVSPAQLLFGDLSRPRAQDEALRLGDQAYEIIIRPLPKKEENDLD
jgi:transcriptional regulator with XRE-family HTH domain